MDTNAFVSGYLLYLLAAASEGASAEFHEKARQAGLRPPEWRVLACLWDEDGAMITRLAKFALMEQSRLTRIIAKMDEKGLVTRAADHEDGRRVRVWLTPDGRRLASDLVASAKIHEAELMNVLGEAEADRIKPALTALIDALERRG